MIGKQSIRVLNIDLSNGTFHIDRRDDLKQYLGGVGVGIKLLDEYMDPDLDVFHQDQPMVFAIGPMETIFPVVTKVAALFRSPLTNELGESYAGMRLGMAIRFSGYDAMTIYGKATKPIYLCINDRGVQFKDAQALWGMDTEETGRLMGEMEEGSGLRSIVRIGPGGENLVRFASVNVDTYRHFGRLGLGALFGSKLLKGMVIHGNGVEPIANKKEYLKLYHDIYKKTKEPDWMGKYHGIGTSINIKPLNDIHGLPTRNLKQSQFEFVDTIRGEAFLEEKLTRKMACTGCPVGCIHLALHRKKFGEPCEYDSKEIAYDHELIFAVGSFLGIHNKEDILSLIEVIEYYGLDCISTGVLLGWMTEAFEKELLTKDQLGEILKFGDVDGYIKTIHNIVKRENTFFADLGRGTHFVAQKYGGQDFACVLGTHEMAGYHTGYGNLVGMTMGARHSHLDNGGYAIDQKTKIFDKVKLVDALIHEEMDRNVQNCLVICLFARQIYDMDTIIRGLATLGIKQNKENLEYLGKDIFKMKVILKKKLGFNYRNIRIPKRFFETETIHGILDEEKATEIVHEYANRVEDILNETSQLFVVKKSNKKLL